MNCCKCKKLLQHNEIEECSVCRYAEAEKEVEELAAELDTPEWDEAFQYLAVH